MAARDGVLPPPASGRLRLRPLLHLVRNLHAVRAAGVHAMGASAGRYAGRSRIIIRSRSFPWWIATLDGKKRGKSVSGF